MLPPRRTLLAATSLTLTLSLSTLTTAIPLTHSGPAPLHKPHERAQVLDDHYIVVLKKEVAYEGVQGHLMMVEEKSGGDVSAFPQRAMRSFRMNGS